MAAPSGPASSSPAVGTPTTPAATSPSPTSQPTPLVHPTPASARNTTSGSGHSGTFTAPAASSAVQGHGSYQILNAHRVHVEVCAKKVGSAYGVGVEAVAYSSDYSKSAEIASVILPQTPGQQGCSQAYLLYTDHLKVYSFIATGGKITKKSAMKSVY